MKHNFGQCPVLAHKHPNGGGLVANSAHVDETVFVGPNAQVFGFAHVLGYARICDFAIISGDAIVYNEARVCGKTHICGYSLIYATKQFVLLDTDNFKCYCPFSDPSEIP